MYRIISVGLAFAILLAVVLMWTASAGSSLYIA
jgi:hypothetical protein